MAAHLTAGQVAGLADRLAHVPAPERPLSASDALARLAPALRRMQSRGHTLESIQAALATEGLKASLRTIRSALGKSKAGAAAKRRQETVPPSRTPPVAGVRK